MSEPTDCPSSARSPRSSPAIRVPEKHSSEPREGSRLDRGSPARHGLSSRRAYEDALGVYRKLHTSTAATSTPQ
jgi:hypothetical protein